MTKSVEEVKKEIQDVIEELVISYGKYKKGGFKLSDIAKFTFDAGSRLVEAVEDVQGLTGEQRKAAVTSSVKDIYKKINPDIPMIPEPFETMIEDVMLDKALDSFIDFLVSKYKEKKIFN